MNPAMSTQSPAPTQIEKEFSNSVRDVLFDFNNSDLRSDQQTTAQTDASFLTQHPDVAIVMEGHCDDRGSEEYNLALGDKRANSLKESSFVGTPSR
ncbi:MAG: OmpA family protein [Acidobacteria bacterium]|nr:OmpA family protein [Acidobacteriota bacterium]